MSAVIREAFTRELKMDSIEFQLQLPIKVLTNDPDRLWASVICGQTVADLGISTNPNGVIGDPDVAVFLASQGACFFETNASNELYLTGLPLGISIAVTTCRKKRPLNLPIGNTVRSATRIEASTVAVTIGPAVGGFFPFLPADDDRRRVTVKTNSAFAALSNGVDLAQFLPVSPFFPGYSVVEGVEPIFFSNFGTGPTMAWAIVDSEVSAL